MEVVVGVVVWTPVSKTTEEMADEADMEEEGQADEGDAEEEGERLDEGETFQADGIGGGKCAGMG